MKKTGRRGDKGTRRRGELISFALRFLFFLVPLSPCPLVALASSRLNFSFHDDVHHSVKTLTFSNGMREEFVMLMADTMAIFFVILGLLLAFPGLWLLCRGLWPRVVTEAAAVCGKGLIRPFIAGLPVSAAMVFAVAALGNFGSTGKIAAGVMVCLYLMMANCGVAGLVTVVGDRLASPPGNTELQQPWRSTLRGGVALGLAALLPILGWFVIFPASMIVGCGASLISLLRAFATATVLSRREAADPVGTAELRATTTFGAEQ
jgi:hypothetical protein